MSEGDGELIKMEGKSPNRQSSVPPKANSADSKKENGGRNRRRDQGGNGGGNKGRSNFRPDSNTGRPVPQKTWGIDKRPRSRGSNNDYKSGEVTQSLSGPEYGSVQAWGSKKTNMNHLLNFHYDSRGDSMQGGGGRGSGGWRSRGRGGGANFNKERFLQANCRFVVRETGSYVRHLVDADVLVDWELIEQVLVFSHEEASCPICLYPPVAAKMTRCGHVYCWPCMLHYLSLEDKSWRKCPICYESVHASDLKSVRTEVVHPYRAGEEVTMRLMKKIRGATAAVPVDRANVLAPGADSVLTRPHSLSDTDETQFAKLLTASPQQVCDILTCETTALQTLLACEEHNSLESSFIEAAMKQLEARAAVAHASRRGCIEVLSAPEPVEATEPGVQDSQAVKLPDDKDAVTYSSAFDNDVAVSPLPRPLTPNNNEAPSTPPPHLSHPITAAEETIASAGQEDTGVASQGAPVGGENEEKESPRGPSSKVKPMTDSYYFYQAADGQHVYLHSVNARCLVKEYGGLQHCPLTITARIVDLEPITMSEDLRRRLRYLSHLPLACEFQVAELALLPPLVSTHTLQLFNDEIEKRKRFRQKKQRDDRRRDRRIQEDENRMFGIDPTILIVPSDTVADRSLVIPSVQRSKASSESCESTPIGSPGSVPDVMEEAVVGSPEDGGQASFSFARMLREGRVRDAPVLSASASAPNLQRPRTGKRGSDSEEGESDDRVPVPVFQASFSDAIQVALDSYLGAKDGEARTCEVSVSAPTALGSKKKKKTKKLLFSTSMNRTK